MRNDWEKQLRQFPLNPKGVPEKLKKGVEERIAMQTTPAVKKHYRRAAAAAVVVLAIGGVGFGTGLFSSLFSKQVQTEAFDDKTERSVKVVWPDGPSFISQYGKAFMIRYPNMTVEAVSEQRASDKTALELYNEMIARDQPDVVYLFEPLYRKLAQEGRLVPLEPLMQKDNYKLDQFQPNVIAALRDASGGGTLYGLTQNYTAKAIYYNKDLFDKYGVPYPTDKMTWDDVTNLVQRFPAGGTGDDQAYGLAAPSYAYDIASAIARTNGHSMIDPSGKTLHVTNASVRSIWEQTSTLLKSRPFEEPKQTTGVIAGEDYYKRNPFITGNAAMSLATPGLANDLKNAKDQYNLVSFAWDIVTEPIDPAHPNRSSSSGLFNGIYAIPVESTHTRDAWELIKLVHEEAMSNKMSGNTISARKPSAAANNAPYRTEAFTMLQDRWLSDDPAVAELDNTFYSSLANIINKQMQAQASGAITLDAALQTIEQEGQLALNQFYIRQEENP